MELKDIPLGEQVFIDANIFVYHFTGVSSECKAFLKRCEDDEINGYTCAIVCAEVLHRLMCVEAINKGLITPGNPVNKLKRQPNIVKMLVDYQMYVSKIPNMGIQVIPVDNNLIHKSAIVRMQTGLLTNDSIIIAAMQEIGVTALATNDYAFDGLPLINFFKPTDV